MRSPHSLPSSDSSAASCTRTRLFTALAHISIHIATTKSGLIEKHLLRMLRTALFARGEDKGCYIIQGTWPFKRDTRGGFYSALICSRFDLSLSCVCFFPISCLIRLLPCGLVSYFGFHMFKFTTELHLHQSPVKVSEALNHSRGSSSWCTCDLDLKQILYIMIRELRNWESSSSRGTFPGERHMSTTCLELHDLLLFARIRWTHPDLHLSVCKISQTQTPRINVNKSNTRTDEQ